MPPIRIERTTRGLGIPLSSTSDNLTPQETTNQEAGTVGADGDGLPYAGSSVVADPIDKKRVWKVVKTVGCEPLEV